MVRLWYVWIQNSLELSSGKNGFEVIISIIVEDGLIIKAHEGGSWEK